MSDSQTATSLLPTTVAARSLGRRQNGKNWHVQKSAFRPKSGWSTWDQRSKQREETAKTKEVENKMKSLKESERQTRIEAIKKKRADKEERKRFEMLEQKMHKKRVERLKRKEKRNKLLNS
ncbi:MAG: hypothetical protein M1814_005735 [Vezdaea aestivalis]|nr:MAG: hypothetical protein M1814_005735 [Vezdaea aestivalis]